MTKWLLFALLFQAGCAHRGDFVSAEKGAWFNVDGHILFWCEARTKETGDPRPACFRPEFLTRNKN